MESQNSKNSEKLTVNFEDENLDAAAVEKEIMQFILEKVNLEKLNSIIWEKFGLKIEVENNYIHFSPVGKEENNSRLIASNDNYIFKEIIEKGKKNPKRIIYFYKNEKYQNISTREFFETIIDAINESTNLKIREKIFFYLVKLTKKIGNQIYEKVFLKIEDFRFEQKLKK